MELRPFDEEDWFAFAGCNSQNPFIGYCRDFTLVVDASHVEVYRQAWPSADPYSMTWIFPDIGTAMLFALSVRGGEPDNILDLKAQEAGGRLM